MPFLESIVETSSTDHSITINGATAGKTVIVCGVIAATIVLHADSVTAGWVQDLYGVNNIGAGIYRLDGSDNPGGDLTLRLTHNGARALAGVAIEDDITGVVDTVAFSEANLGTGGIFTSQSATQDSADLVLVVFGATTTSDANSVDVTAFDSGFTELGDSGWAAKGAGAENARLWVGYDESVALSGTTVTATLNSSAVSWRVSRAFIGYSLAAAVPVDGVATAALGGLTATGLGVVDEPAITGTASLVVSLIATASGASSSGRFFTPPAVQEKWGRHRLFSRIPLDRGVTVLKQGIFYVQVSDPAPEDLTNATAAYVGGRTYEISEEEAAALTAAGYGDYIT